MNIGEKLVDFYQTIAKPEALPEGVELLFPFSDERTLGAIDAFYNKFFSDDRKRVLMLGINPGRFGGGVTGIPFTDPEKLSVDLAIEHDFDSRGELSSQFIYEMIAHMGGPESFYNSFLISSVCPLGFVKEGKNLNYYDIKELQEMLESYMVNNIRWHLDHVADDEVVFSIGQGKNVKYLEYLNKKYQLFGRLVALPHPRWILQYRRKRKDEFLDVYKEKLTTQIS